MTARLEELTPGARVRGVIPDRAVTGSLKDNAREYVTLPDHVKDSLEGIEVLVYEGDNADIAWVIQGLRHIESIKQWGAFQRARYLAGMQQERGLSPAELAEIAPVGRNIISRLIRSYHGFVQACQDEDFGDLVNEEDFSIFQEAVFHRNNSPLWTWLEWEDGDRRFKNEDNLATLLRLRKEPGPDGDPRITRVNPDLRDKFSALVTGDHESELTAFLDDRISLDAAYQQALREEQETETLEDLVNLDSRAASMRDMKAQLATLPILQIRSENRSTEFVELLHEVESMANGQSSLLE